MKRMLSGLSGLTVLALAATTATPAYAHPVNDTLPGGTSISVSIDTPADNAVLPAGPVTVTGTAAIGQGQPVASTALIYVLDVSASTATAVPAGCQGDQNGDGFANEILDCEILAAKRLNDRALSPGTAGTITEVGAAGFAAGAVTADVGPGAGDQLITGPATDANSAGGRDIDQALNSAFRNTGGVAGYHQFTERSISCCNTLFGAGIAASNTLSAAASPNFRKIVVFLSDGFGAQNEDIDTPLNAVPDNADIFTFAVGAGSRCEAAANSLQEIADRTGGTCTEVPDVADLPDILPGVISSELTSLTLSVDGGPATAITNVTPALPEPGPASVDYTVTTGALPRGTHRLCVTASGSDGGGTGSVTDCHTIRLFLPGGAFAIQAIGAVTIPRTPDATCPPGEVLTQAALRTPLGSVNALNASCVVDPGTGNTLAEASVSGASLLGGAVTISDIESRCEATATAITRSSRVGTINGVPIGVTPGTISIPLVAQVFVNESTTNADGQLVQNAVRVRTVLGQEIILASCRLG